MNLQFSLCSKHFNLQYVREASFPLYRTLPEVSEQQPRPISRQLPKKLMYIKIQEIDQ